jgi:sarcosine oxidase gamma subunit
MAQSYEIFTPTAFIVGQIIVTGMTGRSFAPDVRIIAQTTGHITDTTVKNESSYVLLVAPGEWTVTAEVGGVISEPKKVSLESGQSVEINFFFGRRH